jgi:hypothetical protein
MTPHRAERSVVTAGTDRPDRAAGETDPSHDPLTETGAIAWDEGGGLSGGRSGLRELRLTFEAPQWLTTGALVEPIEDFGRLYRMATGIYGRRGYQRADQPFAYARPYFIELEYGSPLLLAIVVPATLLLGRATVAGLPGLTALIRGALLLPSEVKAEREQNLLAAEKARLERAQVRAKLAHPDLLESKAATSQLADSAEAELRLLDALERLDRADPTLVSSVYDSYGPGAVKMLKQIAERRERAPTRLMDPEVREIDNPEIYPDVPPELD